MARTLYDELQDPISTQKEITDLVEELESLLVLTADNNYTFKNEIDPVSQEVLPDLSIEIDKYQKQVLDDWTKKSKTLNDSIERIRSVEDTLKIASNSNSRLKRYLPRFKNEFINDKIQDMESLVGDLSSLKHNGIFYMDNFASTFVYSTIGATLIYATVLNKMSLTSHSPLYSLGIGALTGLVTSIAFGARPSNSKLPWEKAKYIDSLVKKFYQQDNPQP